MTYIWQTSLGTTWAKILLFIVVIAQMFCLTASVTSASRMMYAFSRDRAVPGHQLWRRIAAQRVPMNAVLAIGVLSWLLMVPTLKNAVVGYLVGTSIAVIGLYIAFGIPVYLRLRAGDRFERGAWHLGEKYKWIDVLAIGWIALICILFMLPIAPAGVPWDDAFDWNVVNYAPLTVGGALPALRRLVRALGQEVVQGPGAPGHRGRARADRSRATSRVASPQPDPAA